MSFNTPVFLFSRVPSNMIFSATGLLIRIPWKYSNIHGTSKLHEYWNPF